MTGFFRRLASLAAFCGLACGALAQPMPVTLSPAAGLTESPEAWCREESIRREIFSPRSHRDVVEETHFADPRGVAIARVSVDEAPSASGTPVITRTQDLRWDPFGSLLAVTQRTPAGQGYDRAASYDAAGRLVSKLENPAVAPWSVPPALLARTGAYGADNRMEAFTLGSTMPVVQSADGNMTSGPSPLNPVYGFTYTYDARNRLVSGYDDSTATSYSSTPVNGYGYDPEGNRDLTTQYTEYYEGDTAYGSKEARSLIDPNSGLPRVLRIDSKQNNYITWSTRYVYAGPVLLYQVNNSGVAQHHHYDHAGSTVAVSNEAGIVTGRAAYSTYGVIVGGSGQIFTTPFRWNGAYGVQTDESGLLHMRARYYIPSSAGSSPKTPSALPPAPMSTPTATGIR